MKNKILLPGSAFLDMLETLLNKGFDVRFRVKGFSMAPFIKNGDFITLAPFMKRPPMVGDVVAFIQSEADHPTVHRIIGKKDGRFLIKGDHVSGSDGIYLPADILGYVRKVNRNGEKIITGIGPERFVIAVLSRTGLFIPIVSIWRHLNAFLKKWRKYLTNALIFYLRF